MESLKSDTEKSLVLEDLLSGLGGTILESIRTPFGVFDKNFRILWINRALAGIHRCRPEKVIGEICYEAFHGCNKVCEDCFLEEVRERGRTVVLEKSHDFPDGIRRWGEIHAYPVRAKDRSISAIVVIIFETTSKVETLAKQKKYASILAEKLNVKKDHKVNNFFQELSKREIEILRLIVDGYTNPQISGMLSISNNTVKRHISNLFLKIDVTDRTQAAVRAVRDNLI